MARSKDAGLVDDDQANKIKIEAPSILYEEAMKSFADFVEAYIRRVDARRSAQAVSALE